MTDEKKPVKTSTDTILVVSMIILAAYWVCASWAVMMIFRILHNSWWATIPTMSYLTAGSLMALVMLVGIVGSTGGTILKRFSK